MGKSTISMAIFHSYGMLWLCLQEGNRGVYPADFSIPQLGATV